MATIEVRSQAELDKALAELRPGQIIACVGTGYFTIDKSSSVVARGSSRVVARESSSVVARESSRVVAWGSSSVVAWGSSSVVARESSRVEAWESSSVVASIYVAVTVDRGRGSKAKIQGGVLIEIPAIESPEAWCAYHGVTVVDGIATLYKGVDDDYSTDRARQAGIFYTPGASPIAPDWDKGKAECGGGLHFSPHPAMTLEYNPAATRFVACPVALADLRKPRAGDSMPDKIKAKRVVGPIVEVDRHGDPVPVATAVPA